VAERLSQGSFTRSDGHPTGESFPQFFVDSVLDEIASSSAGRAIYRDEERVKIIMPGNQWSQPVERVNASHKERWPKHYEAFKKGQSISHEGTPIDNWPFLRPANVKELKFLDIYTIEQCAAMSDTITQRIGMGGAAIRNAARAYLDDAEHDKLITQLEADKAELTARLDNSDRQLEELKTLVSSMHGQLMALKDAPNPIVTSVPFQLDPAAIAQSQLTQPSPAASSLESLPRVSTRRRKAEEADA
jgi:hypothetical protein